MVCFMNAFENEKLQVDSDLKSVLDMKLNDSLENVFLTYLFSFVCHSQILVFVFVFDIYNGVTVFSSVSSYTFSR